MKRIKPPKGKPHDDYWRVFRIVEGAVRDAFINHPEYLTEKGRRNAVLSITKRATGSILGWSIGRNPAMGTGQGVGNPGAEEGQSVVVLEEGS